MRTNDPTYLMHDPFFYPWGDGETDIRCRKIKLVRVRKEQTCVPPPSLGKDVHGIAPGTEARLETANVEGSWSKCYTCLDCMDVWLSPPFEGR